MAAAHLKISRAARGRRGTAEFEALMAAIFLIMILLLAVGAFRIAAARLAAGDTAQYQTWHDAYGTQTPQYTADGRAIPIAGAGNLRPEQLPNRVHIADSAQTATYSTGAGGASTVTVREFAEVPGPTWNISGTPVGGADQAQIEAWFAAFALEQTGEVAQPLGLDPVWAP